MKTEDAVGALMAVGRLTLALEAAEQERDQALAKVATLEQKLASLTDEATQQQG